MCTTYTYFVFNTLNTIFFILVPTSVRADPAAGKQRNPPKCTLCKQPMKGHKNVTSCPRNKKD